MSFRSDSLDDVWRGCIILYKKSRMTDDERKIVKMLLAVEY